MNNRYIHILSCVVVTLTGMLASVQADAQVDRRDVRKGNRDFRKENWRESEIDYRKALVKDSLSVAANYNLANTLYREGDMEQARKVMETIKDAAPADECAADYYYNLGDIAIAAEDWQGAVDAFAQSLLRNPGDLNAKENYIYAKKKLRDQQNQQDQNQDQNQNQNQDQNQDNQDDQNQQDQDNDRQNDDQQNDDKKDNDQQDQNQDRNDDNNQDKKQDQQHQGQQPKITPQAAQQMLQAIQAKEKETQDKVNKQKAEALKSRQKDKNW